MKNLLSFALALFVFLTMWPSCNLLDVDTIDDRPDVPEDRPDIGLEITDTIPSDSLSIDYIPTDSLLIDPVQADSTRDDSVITEVIHFLVTPPEDAEAHYFTVVDGYAKEHVGNGVLMDASYIVKFATAGDEVYLQGLFLSAPGSWISGRMDSSGRINFPSGQYLGEATLYDGTTHEAWFIQKSSGSNGLIQFDSKTGTYCFTKFAEAILSFDNENKTETLHQLKFVLAEVPGEESSYSLVAPPAQGEMFDIEISERSYYNLWREESREGRLIVNGNDYFIQGLIPYCRSAWIKGTLSENEDLVEFASDQFIGSVRLGFYQSYLTWLDACSYNGSMVTPKEKFTLRLNKENKTLQSVDEEGCIVYVGRDKAKYLEGYKNIRITCSAVD